MSTTNGDDPRDALHIFAENASASSHNTAMLHSNISEWHTIQVIDILSKNISPTQVKQALN